MLPRACGRIVLQGCAVWGSPLTEGRLLLRHCRLSACHLIPLAAHKCLSGVLRWLQGPEQQRNPLRNGALWSLLHTKRLATDTQTIEEVRPACAQHVLAQKFEGDSIRLA